MPTVLTWDRLRELATYRAQQGCAISLYLNLNPSEVPTAKDLSAHVTSILDAAERSEAVRRLELTASERRALHSDIERIAAWFDSSFDRSGVHGVAIFAAGLDNMFEPLLLSEPVSDSVKVGRAFALAPLVPLVGRADGAIVAVVGREQGHLYRLAAGRLAELADLYEHQLGRHDQGGWSQANYQRHIDGHAQEHLRDVAEELANQVRRLRTTDVVVVGADESRAQFIELLPFEARRAVVGVTHAEAHAGPAELLEAAAPLLHAARVQREHECLERWREEIARDGRAVAGWEGTLEAASDARVELLLFRRGVEHSAFQCSSCGRVSARDGSCPLDGTRMEPTDDAVDLAVQQTLAHGGAVLAVEEGRDLEPVGGIGALLRF
jgi:peptide chain release factor subunit 1